MNGAFAGGGIKVSGTDRLLVTASRPFLETIPLAAQQEINNIPGVAASAVTEFMDAKTGTDDEGFGLLATDPVGRFTTLPELRLPPAQFRKWLTTRDGMVVGKDLARDRGWKLGQRLPVRSSWPKKDGHADVEFRDRRHFRLYRRDQPHQRGLRALRLLRRSA